MTLFTIISKQPCWTNPAHAGALAASENAPRWRIGQRQGQSCQMKAIPHQHQSSHLLPRHPWHSHRCQKSKAPHAWLPRNPHWNECRDNQHQSSMSNALWQDLAWQLYLGKITFFNFFERFYQLFPLSISPVCGRVGWERLAYRFLEYFIYSYIIIYYIYIRIYIYINLYTYIYNI